MPLRIRGLTTLHCTPHTYILDGGPVNAGTSKGSGWGGEMTQAKSVEVHRARGVVVEILVIAVSVGIAPATV